jgi:hypothetical protein
MLDPMYDGGLTVVSICCYFRIYDALDDSTNAWAQGCGADTWGGRGRGSELGRLGYPCEPTRLELLERGFAGVGNGTAHDRIMGVGVSMGMWQGLQGVFPIVVVIVVVGVEARG